MCLRVEKLSNFQSFQIFLPAEKNIQNNEDSLQTTTPPSNKHVKEPCGFQIINGNAKIQKDKNGKQENFLENKASREVRSKTKQARSNPWKSLRKVKDCNIKEIARNVTLHSSMDAGKFKMHGKSNNITRCAEFCCQDRLCNIAVIMNGRCYTGRCFSAKDCESRKVEFSDVVVAYVDNHWQNCKNRSSRLEVAEHEKRNKKTNVPNPKEGNDY